MMKVFQNKAFLAFLVIVGTVIGSGFLSGKEIVVFFTRFGNVSFFCIFLAFLLFAGLFYLFLKYGQRLIEKFRSSKFALTLNCLICLSLICAMFAGIDSVLKNFALPIRILGLVAVLGLSIFVCLKGSGALEKLNLALVPAMIVFAIFNLCNMFSMPTKMLFQGSFAPFGILYSVMYVLLNTSNSAIVISNYSQSLSEKQKVQVSIFSALALSMILLFANIVLLQNSYAFSQDMPLLCLVKGWQRVVMSFVILLGCCTTLFSLVCTMRLSLSCLFRSKFLNIFLCVLLPFCLSFFGFSFIVSSAYPLASVLGCFLLCDLFLLTFLPQKQSFFKRKGKKEF